MREESKTLGETVFPSEEKTIIVHDVNDVYGGAHRYSVRNCLGFADGKTQYQSGSEREHYQVIQFVQKHDDGTTTAGIQSEQLVYVILDRLKKMNTRFPCEENEQQIKGLEMYLAACKKRVENRMQRGVMGDLKK